MRQEQSQVNSELKLGIVGALIIHSVIFWKMPYIQARYDVRPALSAIEVNLIAGGLKKEATQKAVTEEKIFVEQIKVIQKEMPTAVKQLEEVSKEIESQKSVQKSQINEQKVNQAGALNNSQGALIKARPLNYYNPAPVYPYVALQRGYEGEVTLVVAINKSGLPDNVEITQSSGYGILDSAAAKAVQKWKFEPANLFGVAVDSEIEIPIKFELATGQGKAG